MKKKDMHMRIIWAYREKIEKDGLVAFDGLNIRQLKKKLWEIKFSSNRLMYVIEDQNYIFRTCV